MSLFPFRCAYGALASALLASSGWAATLKPAANAVSIEAGSLGAFELAYPKLLDAQQNVAHALTGADLSATGAVLSYAGGGKIEAAISGEEVTYRFQNLPDDVTHLRFEMLIDIGFSRGGRWKLGDKTGPFPAEKPEKPHLEQGNATAFEITNARGDTLAIKMPDFSFQQLTDNREWKWAIFNWLVIVPLDRQRGTATVSIRDVASGKPAPKLVDAFGQAISGTWPGKMLKLEELESDIAAEAKAATGYRPPQLDRFGGLPGSGKALGLKATGFFHVQPLRDRWCLVDPEGNEFFQLGICGFGPTDDYTYVAGREDSYEWLPPATGEFATAYRPGDTTVLSYHLANLIRKYGRPYSQEEYVARMIERVRRWGFNSSGAFSNVPTEAHRRASFPYVAHLPINSWEGIPRIPGAAEVIDPFDLGNREKIEKNMAAQVPPLARDPLLIGWFIVNEPRYDELPRVIPGLDASHACKQRLVQFLQEKYKTIEAFNQAWQMKTESFASLAAVGLPTKAPQATADLKAFTAFFLETFLSLVHESFRRHDPNHLLLGTRLQPITIDDEQLCRITGKYVDVVSFNYYTYGVDPQLLRKIYEWTGHRPMLLSEFFWSSPSESGLIAGWDVKTQQERGWMYRDYVEQAASLGFVVGIQWFTLVDQATTGRWFSKYNGEAANTGLISVVDRPWEGMIREMVQTNYQIYDVLARRVKPFSWTDPRFRYQKK